MLPPSAGGVLASAVIRQALIPMAAGYLLVMVALGLGLLRLRRSHRGDLAGGPERASAGPAAPPRSPGGWPALIRHAVGTALGGYLLLMAVVIGYYYGVARVSGDFLSSAVTGPALLLGLALPVFAAASWLFERCRQARPDGRAPGREAAREDPGPDR